jgi:hypothetical protein
VTAVPSFDVPGPLALDIDGTITDDPVYFSRLAHATRKQGQPLHIVSSRSPVGERDTRIELADLNVPFDFLYLLPDFGKPIVRCPYADLSWYDQYLWQKLEYCLEQGVRWFYEDDPRVLSLFSKYAPHININHGWPNARAT